MRDPVPSIETDIQQPARNGLVEVFMQISESDKDYWHDFLPTYTSALARLGQVERIVEFGVLNGGSIRWLRSKYPEAHITGIDILPLSPDWPTDDKIEYVQADQGEASDIAALFDRFRDPVDLIIEDGSHFPAHQVSCLDIGLPHIRSGGLYILEDIHTSHPAHGLAQRPDSVGRANALNMLLAAQHIDESGSDPEGWLSKLDGSELFTEEQARNLLTRAGKIEIYRRAKLPRRCWSCGKSDFDYGRLLCRCGVDLYAEADSMTALITRR